MAPCSKRPPCRAPRAYRSWHQHGEARFLAHVPLEDAESLLEGILDGNYTVEDRNMLEVEFPGLDLEPGGLAPTR